MTHSENAITNAAIENEGDRISSHNPFSRELEAEALCEMFVRRFPGERV
jgi:hypothetical protein